MYVCIPAVCVCMALQHTCTHTDAHAQHRTDGGDHGRLRLLLVLFCLLQLLKRTSKPQSCHPNGHNFPASQATPIAAPVMPPCDCNTVTLVSVFGTTATHPTCPHLCKRKSMLSEMSAQQDEQAQTKGSSSNRHQRGKTAPVGQVPHKYGMCRHLAVAPPSLA